jgi:hypothetical protein
VKVGDLIRWKRDGYDESLSTIVMPWFEKQGIILEVDDVRIKPPVITVLWSTKVFEKIFADELEVIL